MARRAFSGVLANAIGRHAPGAVESLLRLLGCNCDCIIEVVKVVALRDADAKHMCKLQGEDLFD